MLSEGQPGESNGTNVFSEVSRFCLHVNDSSLHEDLQITFTHKSSKPLASLWTAISYNSSLVFWSLWRENIEKVPCTYRHCSATIHATGRKCALPAGYCLLGMMPVLFNKATDNSWLTVTRTIPIKHKMSNQLTIFVVLHQQVWEAYNIYHSIAVQLSACKSTGLC